MRKALRMPKPNLLLVVHRRQQYRAQTEALPTRVPVCLRSLPKDFLLTEFPIRAKPQALLPAVKTGPPKTEFRADPPQSKSSVARARESAKRMQNARSAGAPGPDNRN